jgi:hypothetical protein
MVDALVCLVSFPTSEQKSCLSQQYDVAWGFAHPQNGSKHESDHFAYESIRHAAMHKGWLPSLSLEPTKGKSDAKNDLRWEAQIRHFHQTLRPHRPLGPLQCFTKKQWKSLWSISWEKHQTILSSLLSPTMLKKQVPAAVETLPPLPRTYPWCTVDTSRLFESNSAWESFFHQRLSSVVAVTKS